MPNASSSSSVVSIRWRICSFTAQLSLMLPAANRVAECADESWPPNQPVTQLVVAVLLPANVCRLIKGMTDLDIHCQAGRPVGRIKQIVHRSSATSTAQTYHLANYIHATRRTRRRTVLARPGTLSELGAAAGPYTGHDRYICRAPCGSINVTEYQDHMRQPCAKRIRGRTEQKVAGSDLAQLGGNTFGFGNLSPVSNTRLSRQPINFQHEKPHQAAHLNASASPSRLAAWRRRRRSRRPGSAGGGCRVRRSRQ